MKLLVAAPGRIHHPAAQNYLDDYTRRIQRIMPVDRLTIREAKRSKGGVNKRARKRESAAVLNAVPQGAVLAALDVQGKVYDSNAFLLWLVGLAESGTRDLVFAIGGPDGHEPGVLEAARYRIALSPMVLPHELAEVVLMEQIYRALTRWKGFPYHR
ncbi:MAG: 23S rRNA (pseudouridine(1915)-N(3))-methyltransferase RlmH [Myxococcales bacterium]|nr:23S rRNA (pseudouridine(1915)-N(3))-methyltransferase RlmH [Myxococcales bacterium]